MKIRYTFIILIFVLIMIGPRENVNGQFAYLNPLPGSSHHNPQVTLAIKNGSFINESSLRKSNWIELVGSSSGTHEYTCRLSDDRKTIIVKPDPVFEYGETVFITIHSKLEKETGEAIEGKSYSFKIREVVTEEQKLRYQQATREINEEILGFNPSRKGEVRDGNLDSLPTYVILVNDNPAPGQIFYCNQYDFDPGNSNSFPTIIENDGTVVWACDLASNGHDFKINYNGYLTYWSYSTNTWIVLDSNFNQIDTLVAGNGYEYETNAHDCSVYPDGHIFLLIFNHQTIDMTPYGGQPDADVIGLVIQEQDKNKDIVFEWSSWDHFEIDDATDNIYLTGFIVDYVHANSIERDTDGNLMISCRHMNELTKIDHGTGDIIWRMNGENNQFTFVNDNIPEHFSSQHDLRRIVNGNVTIYNNGNYLEGPRSSAKEYQLDEVNKVATLIWYYEHPDLDKPVFGPATGSVHRLPNGNTLINWGTSSIDQNRPHFTEVDMDKNITWEFKFDQYGQKSYTAHKYEWNPCSRITPYTMKATPKGAKVVVSWDRANGGKAYEVNYRKLGTVPWLTKNTNKPKTALTGLTKATSYEWRVKTICDFNPDVASGFSPTDTFTSLGFRIAEELSSEQELFKVFPVPASDYLTIRLIETDDATIIIRNSIGIICYEKVEADVSSANVNISQWPAGVYFVEVRNGNSSEVKKIMVE